MALYSRVSFWDNRYRRNELPYEWYQGYQSLRHLLNPIGFAAQQVLGSAAALALGAVPEAGDTVLGSAGAAVTPTTFPPRELCRVLILGCGNSTFGEDMQRDGWMGRIVNLDFSAVVIEQMKAKYGPAFYQNSGVPPMEWVCADMTKTLPFDGGSFDLVVCKASFDAILCGAGSRADAFRAVRECARVLAPAHGIFFLVTHGNPDNRIEYLEYEFDLYHFWSSVNVHHVPRAPHFPLLHHHHHAQRSDYVYICRKRPIEQLGALENVRTDHRPTEDVAGRKLAPSSVDIHIRP